jgi:phage shock protein A
MRWFNDFTLVMRSSVTSFWERVQDPERMLHQLLIDMEEESDRVRESVAGAIADEIQMGRDVEAARAEADQWLGRATAALGRGDEASAQAALERKAAAAERLGTLEREYARQKEQTAKLHRAVRDLEDKIRQARQKRTLLLARLAGAESTRRVDQALRRTSNAASDRSAFAQFARLETKVEREEGLGQAYARLDDRDPAGEELERQFEQAERKERLARELHELKEKLGTPGPSAPAGR